MIRGINVCSTAGATGHGFYKRAIRESHAKGMSALRRAAVIQAASPSPENRLCGSALKRLTHVAGKTPTQNSVALASNLSLARVHRMLNAIHHVALICTDYDRSRRFYVELLGLDLIREVYREERRSWKADLRIGSVQLELFSFPAPVMRPSHPEATGLRHLAFAVANLDPVIVRLEAAGVTVEPIRIDPYTDQRFTFFRDPDELPLELYEVPITNGSLS